MNEIRTFLDIQNAIVDRAKLKLNDDTKRQLKEKINTVYSNTTYEHFYTWSGDTRPLFLPKKYIDGGTITVTQGSDEIVGIGTAWVDNDHRELKMFIAGSNIPFKILRVGSATTITLNQAWPNATASNVSYYIFQDEFGLFPDCQAIRRLIIPGLVPRRQPLPCGPTEIDGEIAKSPFYTGAPRLYTAWGLNHYRSKTWNTFNLDTDFWEDDLDTQPRNMNLRVWPTVRTTDLWAQIRYTKIAYPMDADTDEPVIPFYNRMVLVWGVLVEHFLQNRDPVTKREWQSMYKDMKMKMAAEIETYDDELIIKPDNRGYLWSTSWAFSRREPDETNQ